MFSYKTFFVLLFLFLFSCPSITQATSCKTESGQEGTISQTTGDCVPTAATLKATRETTATATTVAKTTGGLVPCGHGDDVANACTLCDLIIGFKKLIDFGSEILIAVTVAGIFISGVMYIISAGSDLTTKAKSFLSASLIGFTIVLAAWLIVNVTMWALSYDTSVGIGKTNWYTFDCTSTGS